MQVHRFASLHETSPLTCVSVAHLTSQVLGALSLRLLLTCYSRLSDAAVHAVGGMSASTTPGQPGIILGFSSN